MVKDTDHNQLIAGHFEISDPESDLLGRGSMGEVYRATDIQTGKIVAVKALDPKVIARDPGILERFVREGHALRKLNHPNIVHMVAAVEDEAATPSGVAHYLVMEYVPGGSLYDLLQAQVRLPIQRVLEIALDLADALTRAHHLGIIHRDLKPANVLLANDGTPKLTDFGIARVTDSPRLTQTGVLIGTINYLSPESCEGKTIDERGDIWSLGVMLYEMLSGELPFGGETVIAILQAILTQPVPDLAERCPDAPEALMDLIYRMLEKDRQQRVPSARLVGAELEAILKGRQVPSMVRHAFEKSRFSTPTPDVTKSRNNLPVQPTPFVGRQAELAELARLLADPEVHLLTILGAGGMGKTRLALETGAAQLVNFQHGVYFVPLAPLQSMEAIVPTTAEALGFSFYEGGQPQQQLLEYLRQKHLLLIMDNFEHLLTSTESNRGDGVGLVRDILNTDPAVKILVTSRTRLNVQGECLFHLTGMDIPVMEMPNDARDYGAIKLFWQCARRVKPGFELTAVELKPITRICRLVDGMPLGILLAAAWLTMLTPAEIEIEIETSLDFLETEISDFPERQHSIRAVFDHSWDLLSKQEQAVMAAMSVFRGGFTREAAQLVTGATLRDLRDLVDKSLLQRDPTGRYSIHELLQQYGAEKLRKVPSEGVTTKDQHCSFYANFLQKREAHSIGRGQKQALSEISTEIENIRIAWDWAVIQSKAEEMDLSLGSLAEFYRIRALFQEGAERFAKAAHSLEDLQQQVGDRGSKMVLGKVLLQQGCFCYFLGLAEQASESIQRSLAIFRDLSARKETAYALYYLGNLFDLRGGESKSLHQEALVISKEIGDRRGIALALSGLGGTAISRGEYRMAKQLLQESLAIFRELGNQQGIAESLDQLGYIAWVLGEYRLAKQLDQENLALCRETSDRVGITNALISVARTAAGLGEFEMAKQHYLESIDLSREIGYLKGIEDAFGDLGEVANILGEYSDAIKHAQECLIVSEQIVEPSGIAWALRILGNAACGLGDLAGAKRYHHQSLELVMKINQKFYIPLNLVGIAELMAVDGKSEQALELLALVLHHPISWQWAKDQAAPLLTKLKSELAPEVVAATCERGQSRDLEVTVAELLAEIEESGTDSFDQLEYLL